MSLQGLVFVLLKSSMTLSTKVLNVSLGQIGNLKRISDKSLFSMVLGSRDHRITHQLRPINMNGRSILSVMSYLVSDQNSNDYTGLHNQRQEDRTRARRSQVGSARRSADGDLP